MVKFLKRWERQSNYMGEDFSDYYVVLGINRDSDTLACSNFIVAEKRLSEIPYNDDDLAVVRFSHWAVGWIELIMVHVDAEALVLEADDILQELDLYPVLNESHWSELQWREAEEYWESASKEERQWVLDKYGSDDCLAGIPYDFIATF